MKLFAAAALAAVSFASFPTALLPGAHASEDAASGSVRAAGDGKKGANEEAKADDDAQKRNLEEGAPKLISLDEIKKRIYEAEGGDVSEEAAAAPALTAEEEATNEDDISGGDVDTVDGEGDADAVGGEGDVEGEYYPYGKNSKYPAGYRPTYDQPYKTSSCNCAKDALLSVYEEAQTRINLVPLVGGPYAIYPIVVREIDRLLDFASCFLGSINCGCDGEFEMGRGRKYKNPYNFEDYSGEKKDGENPAYGEGALPYHVPTVPNKYEISRFQCCCDVNAVADIIVDGIRALGQFELKSDGRYQAPYVNVQKIYKYDKLDVYDRTVQRVAKAAREIGGGFYVYDKVYGGFGDGGHHYKGYEKTVGSDVGNPDEWCVEALCPADTFEYGHIKFPIYNAYRHKDKVCGGKGSLPSGAKHGIGPKGLPYKAKGVEVDDTSEGEGDNAPEGGGEGDVEGDADIDDVDGDGKRWNPGMKAEQCFRVCDKDGNSACVMNDNTGGPCGEGGKCPYGSVCVPDDSRYGMCIPKCSLPSQEI